MEHMNPSFVLKARTDRLLTRFLALFVHLVHIIQTKVQWIYQTVSLVRLGVFAVSKPCRISPSQSLVLQATLAAKPQLVLDNLTTNAQLDTIVENKRPQQIRWTFYAMLVSTAIELRKPLNDDRTSAVLDTIVQQELLTDKDGRYDAPWEQCQRPEI
jgi:hypothetical protein